MRKITLIENGSELGAGTRGASLGVKAVKMAGFKREIPAFRSVSWDKIENLNDKILFRPILYPFAIKIDAMVEMYGRIAAKIQETLQAGHFPFILSGDHSNAGGTIAGIKLAHPDKRIGVIWIDAHADIHSPYTTPSGNLHGMPVATALGLDKPESPVNQPDTETCVSWDKLCNLGGIRPKIQPEDIVYFQIRDLEPEEWNVIHQKNIRFFQPDDLRTKGIAALASEALRHLQACDLIYVSFDVDSMDPSVSEGTGTTAPDGLSASQALELLSLLWAEPRLACLEITEVNPLLDTRNKMAETVVDFIDALTRIPV